MRINCFYTLPLQFCHVLRICHSQRSWTSGSCQKYQHREDSWIERSRWRMDSGFFGGLLFQTFSFLLFLASEKPAKVVRFRKGPRYRANIIIKSLLCQIDNNTILEGGRLGRPVRQSSSQRCDWLTALSSASDWTREMSGPDQAQGSGCQTEAGVEVLRPRWPHY